MRGRILAVAPIVLLGIAGTVGMTVRGYQLIAAMGTVGTLGWLFVAWRNL